ncbi:MAG: TIM barrel protein [Bryobacteraceae bacterium]
MNRRTFIATAAGACAGAAAGAPYRSKMGIAVTSYMTFGRPKDTLQFLEYANALGAGGIQMPLTSENREYARKVRRRTEELGLYFELIGGLPKDRDTSGFEQTVAAAQEAGARCIRVNCLPGRRYEDFTSLAQWNEAVGRAHKTIDAAARIVEKQQIPLAIENHKDWTADEFAALMRAKSGRWVGACLDTGNNIALLDDPMAVVEALAPFAVCTHLKDMGVEPYAGGFLLAEMPLGAGMLDLRRIVDTIQKARPGTRLSLEMITRDPLKVPCLSDAYWTTFPERSGRYLARTLRMVAEKRSARPLPVVENLPRDVQLRQEEDNVKASLEYAQNRLGL